MDTIQVESPSVGQPSPYKRDFARIAKQLCKLGATDRDLAETFNVSISTISLWKVTHKSFSDSIRLGKAETDARVEQSLYQRAMGYSHEDVELKVVSDGESGSHVEKIPVIKHYPPDPTSMIFWLKNRRPKEWRDKIETQLSNADGTPIQVLALEVAKVLAGQLARPEPKQIEVVSCVEVATKETSVEVSQ